MVKHTPSELSKYSSLHINGNFLLVFYFSCYLLFGMCTIVLEKAILIRSVDTVHDSVSVLYALLIIYIYIEPSIQLILNK